MQIVILAPPEPPRLGGEEGMSLADTVHQAMIRLDGAEYRWAGDEKDLARELVWGGDVLVVAATTMHERQIRRILELRPPPLVVVTPDPAAMALALRSVAVQEIVEPDAKTLALAIQRQADTSLLARTARVAEAHPRFSPIARRWMALTLTARPPYGSVSAAARDLRVSRNTVDVHWGEDVGSSRPKQWLEWIQLTCAVERRRGTGSWIQVAGWLRISVRTLERISWRRTKCRLSQLDVDLAQSLREAERYFVAVLPGESVASRGVSPHPRCSDLSVGKTSR